MNDMLLIKSARIDDFVEEIFGDLEGVDSKKEAIVMMFKSLKTEMDQEEFDRLAKAIRHSLNKYLNFRSF